MESPVSPSADLIKDTRPAPDVTQENAFSTLESLTERMQSLFIRQRVLAPNLKKKSARKEGDASVDETGVTYVDRQLMQDLLEPEEERFLVQQHHRHRKRYIALLARDPANPRLKKLFAEWNAARTKIVGSNLRLIKHVAKSFKNSLTDYDDLCMAGAQGLLIGLDDFELRFGTRLASYTTWRIRQQIQMAVTNGGTPVSGLSYKVVSDWYAINSFVKEHQDAHGGEDPADEEIMKALHMTEETLHRIRGAFHSFSLSESFRNNGEDTLINSLAASRDGVKGKFGEDISSSDENETTQEIMTNDRSTGIQRTLADVLRPRELRVVQLRYFQEEEGGKNLGLREVGHILKISKERVRQIQLRAFRRIRNVSPDLKDLLE